MTAPPDWDGLTRAVEQEDAERRRQGEAAQQALFGKRGPWYGLAGGASLLLLALGLFGPFSPWPIGPSEVELQRGRQLSLGLVAQALHDYAQMHGRYPARLDEVTELQIAGVIEYQASAQGFRLAVPDRQGQTVEITGR